MGEHAPSSRGDFPLNAFALLPPSIIHDSAVSTEQIPVSATAQSALEVEKSTVQVEITTGSSPVGMLQMNLAHTELRATIEALYVAMESLGQERATLQRENGVLVEKCARAKDDVTKTSESLRTKLQACEYELMQTQHTLREAEKQKDRLQSEKTEMRIKLEEHEATISTMQSTIQRLHEEHAQVRDTSRQEAELRRLNELWASKGRSMTENSEHLRNATIDVQRLAEQLQNQLAQVQSELQDNEKEHASFRDFIDQHQCASSSMNGGRHENMSTQQQLSDLTKQVHDLQQAKLDMSTENEVLRTKCTEYMKSIRLLSSSLEHAQARDKAVSALVNKYRASADDGTQTIAELQESLVKLCDQLAQERKQHIDHLNEQMRTALTSENALKQELDTLQEKLRVTIEELEAVSKTKHVTGDCTRCGKNEAQSQPSHTVVRTMERQKLPSPPSLGQERVCTSKANSETTQQANSRSELPQPVSPDKGDKRREEFDKAEKVKRNAGMKRDRDRETLSKTPAVNQATSCRLCSEEPFGFMVRCQKCKDVFHAGCVKKGEAGAKKRLGHIFKCSNCAPQRPNKVAHLVGNKDTSQVKIHDLTVRGQRSVPLPIQVIPTRNETRTAVASKNAN